LLADLGYVAESALRRPARRLRVHPQHLVLAGARLDVKLELFIDLALERATREERHEPYPAVHR
jgi:hypothetical protein